MAELKILPIDELLSSDQLDQLAAKLAELGVDGLSRESDDPVDLDSVLSDDHFADFVDRLEAHDVAADVYLPVEFEGRVELGDHSFASAFSLTEALEELKDELNIGGEDTDEDEIDMEMIEEQLSYAWRAFAEAAQACIDKRLALQVIS